MLVRLGLTLALFLSTAARGGEPYSPKPTTPTTETAASDAKLNAEVAGWLNALDQADIDQAKFVMGKTANLEVKQFAEDQISTHTAMRKRTQTFLETHMLKAMESTRSTETLKMAKADLASLQGLSGGELDRMWLGYVVANAERAIDQIDAYLMAKVNNAEMRSLLAEDRSTCNASLDRARKLGAMLEGKATGTL